MSKILIVCVSLLASSVVFAERGLIETEEGLTYVSVGREYGDQTVVGISRASCRFFCSRSSGSQRVDSGAILHPTDSIVIESEGSQFRVGQGRVVLGRDGHAYEIRDVFEDGDQAHVAAYRVTRRDGDPYGVQDGIIDPSENRNIYVFNANEIQAVEVDCFLGICSGRRYHDVAGAPLCDFANLRDVPVENGVVIGVPRLNCRVDRSAPIDIVFNDGTLVNGATNVFNPFPPTLRNYYRYTEARGAEEDTKTAL